VLFRVYTIHVWVVEGCREIRRCSRDTYPGSYITKYTSIRDIQQVYGVYNYTDVHSADTEEETEVSRGQFRVEAKP